MNILVVDDDSVCRSEMADFLRKLGHHVDECANGLDAVNCLRIDDYEMVLSDIKMPKMSGIELLRAFAESPKRFKTDFVFTTAYSDLEFAIEALRARAYNYLLKPIDVKELAQITEQINERHNKRIIRVLLFISSTIVREGLNQILKQNAKEFKVLGQTVTLEETINVLEKTKPDVVIICHNNIRQEKKFARIKDEVKFKTLALCPETFKTPQLPYAAGNVDGILSKEADINEILMAIKTVHKGIFYVSPNLMDRIFKQQALKDRLSKLNQQENNVLFALAQGKTNKKIAEELYLSDATVKTYVSRILNKLNVPNRATAAIYASKVREEGHLKKNHLKDEDCFNSTTSG